MIHPTWPGLALALLIHSASFAQGLAEAPRFPLRPTVSVEFSIEPTRYLAAGVDHQLVAREIEDKLLYRRTFLRAPAPGETAQYKLRVTLIEKENDSAKLRPAYLRYQLEKLDGEFEWSPTEGLAYFQPFRDAQSANNEINAHLSNELSKRIQELAASPDELVQGLLCYIPLATAAVEPRQACYFWDAGDNEFEVRLPFRKDDVGLKEDTEYLLYVQAGDRRVFHTLRAEDVRRFTPVTPLPSYLADGVVGRDTAKELDKVRAIPASAASTALCENQLPEKRIQPIVIHGEVAAEPRLLDTISIHVVRAKPMTFDSKKPAGPGAVDKAHAQPAANTVTP